MYYPLIRGCSRFTLSQTNEKLAPFCVVYTHRKSLTCVYLFLSGFFLRKLPLCYLVDSVLKNIGEPYIALFGSGVG